jgi:hypothetical protein
MALKTKDGIRSKQKIVEHQKLGYLSAKIVQYFMALKTKAVITRKQKKGSIRNQAIYPLK